MLSGRITKWTLVALGVAAVVLYARGLVHDLSLQTTLVRKGLAHLPAMVVEHIGVEREFSGVLWKGSVDRAERGESGILLSSIDLLGEWPEGRRVKFIAPEARFEEASELATRQYEAGQVDLLTVLDVQRTQLSVEESRVLTETDQLNACVQLYKSLGCGWQPL